MGFFFWPSEHYHGNWQGQALNQRWQEGAKYKDWCDLKALAMFNIRNIGKALDMRTQGTKIAVAVSSVVFIKGVLLTCRMMELHLENSR